MANGSAIIYAPAVCVGSCIGLRRDAHRGIFDI